MAPFAGSPPEIVNFPNTHKSHPASRLSRALADLAAGLCHRELWAMMGWQDIRHRYRRSVLGPVWLTLNMGFMVAGLGIVYSGIFGQALNEYLPFLALGFIAWTLLAGLLIDSTMTFIASEAVIRQIAVPLSVFVYRVLWRHLIILAHNIWVYVAVAAIVGLWPGAAALWAAPALALYCLNGLWVGLLLGAASARFRDIPQFVANLVPVFFLLTPILWRADQAPGRAWFVTFNPFHHFIEIMRMPLLGGPAALESWLVVIGITVAGWGATLAFFARYRARIAYWL